MIEKLFITLVLFLTAITTQSQTVFHSIDEVWKYADDHNVSLRTSKYELTKAIDARTQSYMAFLPQVSANAGFTDNTSLQTTLVPDIIFGIKDGGYKPAKFGQQYIYNAGVTAQLDLVNTQTWFNLRIAKANEELNRASLANTHKTVYQQVASQYYSCLLANAAAILSEKSKAIADSIYQSVHHKYAEGTANKANDDVAELNLRRAQETLITAQYQALTAKNNLRLLLDLSVTDSLIIADVLEEKVAQQSLGTFSEDPAINLAWYQTQKSMASYRSVKSGIVPSLSLGYTNNTQQSDNEYRPFQGGAPWYPAVFWTVKATWNIFTAGNRWLQIQQNKINFEESALQYESAKKQSAINDDNLRLSYARSVALYEKAKEVMELSFDNYTHITNRYNTGIASIEDRLTAFSDYINYQNQYLNNLSDMLVQVYNIKIRQKTF